MSPNRWSRCVAILLAVHLVWGLARVPTKVVARRWQDIAELRQQGASRFHFDGNRLRGDDVIELVRRESGDDTVVLWRGSEAQSMEFAAALLWPRLLVRADAVGNGSQHAGRNVLMIGQNGKRRPLTIVADGSGLSIEGP